MQLEVTSILTAVTCAPPAPLVCAVSEPDWAPSPARSGTLGGGPSRGAEVVAHGPAVNDPAVTTYVLWGVRRNQPIRP
jgi:hypothetical protein